jgi:hypothetical protein
MYERDPVAMQAIKNVSSRQTTENHRVLTPREATQTIYDEIRRLDLERVNEGTASPAQKVTESGAIDFVRDRDAPDDKRREPHCSGTSLPTAPDAEAQIPEIGETPLIPAHQLCQLVPSW